MSLINDALNRSRADAAQRDAKSRGEIAPPPVLLETTTLGPPVWLAAAGGTLMCLIWLLWPGGEATRANRPAVKTTTEAPTTQVDAATGLEPTPAATGVASIPARPAPLRRDPGADAVPAGGSERTPEHIAESTAALAGEPERAAPAPPPAAARPEDGSEDETWYYVDTYTLPSGGRIELAGIAWSTQAASAMLNGALLTVGDEILGLEVTGIGPRTVTLAGSQGRRIALELGPGGH